MTGIPIQSAPIRFCVGKAKARYDAAVKDLRDLLEQKDAQRKQELLKAVENSPRSFDEIMTFLKAEE